MRFWLILWLILNILQDNLWILLILKVQKYTIPRRRKKNLLKTKILFLIYYIFGLTEIYTSLKFKLSSFIKQSFIV